MPCMRYPFYTYFEMMMNECQNGVNAMGNGTNVVFVAVGLTLSGGGEGLMGRKRGNRIFRGGRNHDVS